MPLTTQAKLLRVLESGEVMRVGSVKTKRIDFRLISATNRDLRARIDQGQFRSDLFFRLNGIALTIPPLRERRDDLIAFARNFLDSARRRFGAPPATFSPAATEALVDYAWPGNVRELRNTIDRAALLCKDRVVEPSDLAIHSRGSAPPACRSPRPPRRPRPRTSKRSQRTRARPKFASRSGNSGRRWTPSSASASSRRSSSAEETKAARLASLGWRAGRSWFDSTSTA